MAERIILILLALTLTTDPAYASNLQVRGFYGTNSIYSGSKNKVHVQLSTRAYYAIKNEGIENVDIRLKNHKYTKNIKINTRTTNAYLKGRTLIFSLPNNSLKYGGVHSLSITASNQSFDSSFNYVPKVEVVNNTSGLDISSFSPEETGSNAPTENITSNETEDGLIVESITEEPVQIISNDDSNDSGLEISF